MNEGRRHDWPARGRREADAQLLALLDDLVHAEGRLKAAQALGGNYRTLV